VNQNPTDASKGVGWLRRVVEWHRGSGGVGRGIAEMSKCDSNIPRISSTFRMRIWKDEADGSTDRSLHVNMRKDAGVPCPKQQKCLGLHRIG